jgi:hypothetical protein
MRNTYGLITPFYINNKYQTCVEDCGELYGFFLNDTTDTCDACPYGCDTCTNSTYCDSCSYGYYMQKEVRNDFNWAAEDASIEKYLDYIVPFPTGQCTSYCPGGFFGNKTSFNCEECPEGCSYCTGDIYRDRAMCTQC